MFPRSEAAPSRRRPVAAAWIILCVLAGCKTPGDGAGSAVAGMYDCDDCPAWTEEEGRQVQWFVESALQPVNDEYDLWRDPIPRDEIRLFGMLERLAATPCDLRFSLIHTGNFVRRVRMYHLHMFIAVRTDVGAEPAPVISRELERIFPPADWSSRNRRPNREQNPHYALVERIQGAAFSMMVNRKAREVCGDVLTAPAVGG